MIRNHELRRAGLKPCISCKNIVNRVRVNNNGYLQPLWCCDYEKFDLHTNASIYEAVDLLRAQKNVLNKSKFDELQKFLGINYDEESLLFCDELRTIVQPRDACIRDWMHTLVSGGVAGTEISLLLQELQKHVPLSMITEYALCYNMPRSQGQPSADWFTAKRISDDQMRTPAASDNLAIVELLNAFITDVIMPTGVAPEHCKCFALLTNMIVILKLGAENSMPF